jgi:hypothetical protein
VSATAAGRPRCDWVRLTYPLGRVDGAYAEEHGWILPLPEWFLPDRKSFFASLEQLRDRPVIVLTGAGGTGKSTALIQEHQALTAKASCRVDLKSLARKPDRVADLSERTQMPDQADEEPWHVLLDGFDEAVNRGLEPVDILKEWLAGQPQSGRGRLRLRLATRPAVQENAALAEMLRQYWPADGAVEFRDLAPLSRDDVLHAARARGVPDPGGFVAALERDGLVPTVTLPVPLLALIDLAAEKRPLPETAGGVYQLACERLCEESSPGRRRSQRLGLRELTECAGYLAAVLEFCGNGVMTTGLDTYPGGPVRLVDVAAAMKPDAGGDAEDALRWLITTPLLQDLTGGMWQFAHQHIQAYLAADYLKGRELARASVHSLLFAGPGLVRYVHPGHREAAGWLAWRRPEVYREVHALDPAALLSPDLPAQPPDVRAEVVAALFRDAGQGKELSRPQDLHRAAHLGLRSQLAAQITSAAARQGDAERRSLELALALVRACPDHASAGGLLEVAEDAQADVGIRVAAVETIPAVVVAAAAGRLNALAGAPDAEIAAAALLKLWPAHMPVSGLLARMPLSAPRSYWKRVRFGLQAADAGEVIAWLTQQCGSGKPTSLAVIMELLAWACSILMPAEGEEAQQKAAGELAGILVPLLRDHAYAMEFADLGEPWARDLAWRRFLAGEVLARLTGDDAVALDAAVHGQLGLFPQEDSIYWARKAAADADGGLAVLGSPLILPYPGDSPELSELRDEAKDNLRLRELTARWFAAGPAWLREAKAPPSERRAEIAAELERLAAERPAAEQIRPWWGTIVQWLARDPQQFHRDRVPVHLDLTAAPSCPEPGGPLRTALQAAALHAIGQAPEVTAASISAVAEFADACEVTALSLLDDPPVLTPERWAGLALVLASANCLHFDEEPRRTMLLQAAGQAGPAFTAALPAALSARSPQWAANVADTLARTVLGCEADRALLAWAADPGRPVGVWQDTMRALAAHDRPSLPVLAGLARLADRDLPPDDGADARSRWALAADLLLLHGPQDRVQSRWEQVLASEEATIAWAMAAGEQGIGFSLVAHAPVAYWPATYQQLTPQQAAQLYDRLARHRLVDFPRQNPVPSISGPGRRGIHNRLPELIAAHLTDTAARELQGLAAGHPAHPGLPVLAADHARRLSENLWPLTLGEFTLITADMRRRVVRDARELTQVVLDAIDTLQRQALRSHSWSMLMWNREDEAGKDGWWPTWEDNLSNLVCAFLREHLAEQKPVINREVEIQPKKLDGGRTDVHVQASDPRDAAAEPLTVIIEVKGCWNPEIKTGVSEQLLPYLQPRPGWVGIFLVGYFHQRGREHEKYTGAPKTPDKPAVHRRHRTPMSHTSAEILSDLQQQIDSAPRGVVMHARVLRLPLIPPAAGTVPA